MKLMAVYHAGHLEPRRAEERTPALRRGRDLLLAEDARADGELMACSLGRLRNHAALARELGTPAGAPVSELVIAAYRRWGVDYAAHLEGGVLTVLVDRSCERMLASRDVMGDRRLFYCRHGRTVALCDHPDALLETPYASSRVDLMGLNELFALGPARTPGRTPYRDIFSLEPGCVLIAERSGVRVQRYDALTVREHEDDTENTVKRVRELLERAVEEERAFAGASMLSGGVDSTAITALLHENGWPVRTYSVDYEGDEADFTGNRFQPERDRAYAAMAAERFSAGHRNVLLDYRGLTRGLGDALDARGFPGMADVDSSFLLFAWEIARTENGVFSGEGGDEVFCGYPWFAYDAEKAQGFPWSGSLELRRSILRRDVAEKMKIEQYAEQTFRAAMEGAPRLPGEAEEDAYLRALQWVCIRFFMANLQERALCMCESCNLEILTPFTNRRLAEYVWNVPSAVKFLNGETKGLLRAAVADLLPEELLHRKKSPYPKVYAAEYTEEIRRKVNELLEDTASPILQVVDAGALEQICRSELPAGGLPWFGQLMSGPQMLAYLWQVNEWMATRKVELTFR